MEWNWATKAFISYDPYTDTRIDTQNEKGDSDDRVPFFLHNAVRRAKVLVGYAPISEIISDVEFVRSITIDLGIFIRELRPVTKDGKMLHCAGAGLLKDYLMATSGGPILISHSEEWKSLYGVKDFYLGRNRAKIAIERWPYFFGVLALTIAGEIVNELWPTDEFLSVPPRYDNGNVGCGPDSPDYLTDREEELLLHHYAADALQAVGFGEGLLVAEEYRKKYQSAAKKSPKAHQRLYDIFNNWALSQPSNHGFGSTEDAVNIGFKHYLTESDELRSLLDKIGERTHRTLKEKLENHSLLSR